MGGLRDLIGIGKVVEKVGKVVGDVHTSTDEKNKKANERLAIDSNTESWLTRSVRPLIMVLFSLFFFSTVYFEIEITDKQNEIMFVVFQYSIPFYFGGRLIEKITRRK